MTEPLEPCEPIVEAIVATAFREEWGRVVATLVRRTGDFDLAEECAQEAFTKALGSWRRNGVPERPGAWLMTVAANLAIDRLRHATRESTIINQVGVLIPTPTIASAGELDPGEGSDAIPDERLRLIFTCCHPALSLEARVALTLRTLTGLSTQEIARAFLVPEATMAKRLVRAKHKIANAGIPFRVPEAAAIGARTSGVLAVLYLMFNEGYAASNGSELVRTNLCENAIALARLVTSLLPDDPEVKGLLALMLFHHARREARLDEVGDVVTLEDQDRSRWNIQEITEGGRWLDAARQSGDVGPYQLQAALAREHVAVERASDTDWYAIVTLYDELLSSTGSPVVALNRAVAVAMCDGPLVAMSLVDSIAHTGTLDGYYLLPAVQADLHRRLGNTIEAAKSYREALELVGNEPERRFLEMRLAEVTR